MRVICCIIELYVVFIGVSKKRSFNGQHYHAFKMKFEGIKMRGY